jgi:hypothetical protein
MNKLIPLALAILLLAAGCGGGPDTSAGDGPAAGGEPERLEVQHILISFQGAIPKPEVVRSQAEAEALARELFQRARDGEDFDALVREYTDDEYPGIYRMANDGVTADRAAQEYPRAVMVKAFGDVSFGLAVGEIGMTTFDPATSKYGWHIIKRLK